MKNISFTIIRQLWNTILYFGVKRRRCCCRICSWTPAGGRAARHRSMCRRTGDCLWRRRWWTSHWTPSAGPANQRCRSRPRRGWSPSGDKFQGLAAEKVYYNRRCDTAELVERNSETFKGCCAYRYFPFLYLDLIRESTWKRIIRQSRPFTAITEKMRMLFCTTFSI